MKRSLALLAFLIFGDLTSQNCYETGFQEHFVESYEAFDDEEEDLRLGKLESYTILYF